MRMRDLDATLNTDGGMDAACTTNGCSADLHTVLDCMGNKIMDCPPTQACGAGMCMPPCDAAKANKASIGCEYYTFRPRATAYECYAMYVANTWNAPITIDVDFAGTNLTVSNFARIPVGTGVNLTYKNLTNGNVIERTWKSGESVELADVDTGKMTYSWAESDTRVFMETTTGEQIHVENDKLGDEARFLIEGLDCEVTLYNGNAIAVELPASVVVQITASEPGIKGDTASGATKPATLASGATVNVPLFIKEGEWIKIDTTSGQYLERVNK
jgi:elongation factor P